MCLLFPAHLQTPISVGAVMVRQATDSQSCILRAGLLREGGAVLHRDQCPGEHQRGAGLPAHLDRDLPHRQQEGARVRRQAAARQGHQDRGVRDTARGEEEVSLLQRLERAGPRENGFRATRMCHLTL